MVVGMKMAVFWIVTSCNLVEIHHHLRDTCCLHPKSSLPIALMIEAAGASETLVNFYQTTQHLNPEDSHLQ
jgi:hypothetical protein